RGRARERRRRAARRPVRSGGRGCRCPRGRGRGRGRRGGGGGRPLRGSGGGGGQLVLFEGAGEEIPAAAPRLRELVVIPAPPPARVTRLSYSAISLFDRCGYRYYAERVAGMKPTP